MMNPNRDPLLQPVYEAGFTLDELVLFLDTHPCDMGALSYYRQASSRYAQAVSDYESQRGPLTIEGVNSANYWTWVEGPWPWEGGCE